MGVALVRPLRAGCSPALADARELLAPPDAVAPEGFEAELETATFSEPSKRRCGARRFCCAAVAAAATAAACITAMCFWPGSSPEAVEALIVSPSFEGTVPAEQPFFLQHIGGICFGRKRVETNTIVGELVFELSAEGGREQPWIGRGELYVLVYDDEPRHWGIAQQTWDIGFWSRLADLSNFCAQVAQLWRPAGGEARLSWGPAAGHAAPSKDGKARVSLRIQEKVTRQWRLALLGMDWRPDPELLGNITYRVTGLNGLSGWVGGAHSLPPKGKCPDQNWEAIKERVWDFFAPPDTGAPPPPPQPHYQRVQARGLARCARAV